VAQNNRNYRLDLFTWATSREFLNAGAEVSVFVKDVPISVVIGLVMLKVA
jgi:hypothetical protein